MSYYASGALPWTVSEEDEGRFRKILKRIFVLFVLLCLIWPWLPVPKTDRHAAEEVPPRLAKLVLENRQVPPPVAPKAPDTPLPETAKTKPEAAKKEVKKEVAVPPDATKRTEIARQKASRSGLLAFKDDLSDLRDNAVAAKLNKDLKPGPGLGSGAGPGVGTAAKGPAMGSGARAIITSNAASGSGGIAVARLSQGTGGGGLAGRSTTQVNSPIGGGAGGGGGGGSLQRGGSGKSARSLEEIRLVFDRNKGSIYTLYNRALREDSTLQGKVVLKLTIAASGQVLACDIISSELSAPELERKLLARIKQFDFGAKEVDVMVVTYPIDFLPS
jgi:protein TonB